MAKISSFRHYSLDQATRYVLNVTTFLGVDYSTQKFLVSDGHATDMKNFVFRDGVVQKRHGTETVYQMRPTRYIRAGWDGSADADSVSLNCGERPSDAPRFNGMWRFLAEDGIYHVIAHIGKLLYEIKDLGEDWVSIEPISLGTAIAGGEMARLCYEFEDYKSSAYVGGRKLWFQGGNKYMCLRYVGSGDCRLKPCENDESIAPIPTTCVSIAYKDARAGQRMPLDAVNLLTKWRKNKLVSGIGKGAGAEKTENYEYVLDAPLIWQDEDKDMASFSIQIEECGKTEE